MNGVFIYMRAMAKKLKKMLQLFGCEKSEVLDANKNFYGQQ